MYPRVVGSYAFQEDWMRRKMIFLAGPRQVGKTVTAREYLKRSKCPSLYFNWDLPETSVQYRIDPWYFESEARNLNLTRPTLVFDEIHKRSQWRKELKAVYDRLIPDMNIVVTGSARLDLLRRSGESLAGRYFLFRVLPLGLLELTQAVSHRFELSTFEGLLDAMSSQPSRHDEFEALLRLGGFPDPLSVGTEEYRTKWAADYQRFIFREDLRDLSRIQELDRVETLWTLLPDRVGAPISVQALREDLGASHEAVRTWLLNLEKLYLIYFISPYHKRIARAVKKERKLYLMDWALHSDTSKRFENFVMSSLMRATTVWTDSGQGAFELHYVRNVFKKEADFLITKNGRPWLLGDIKISAKAFEKHHYQMSEQLGGVPLLLIVAEKGVFQRPSQHAAIVSAERALGVFP